MSLTMMKKTLGKAQGARVPEQTSDAVREITSGSGSLCTNTVRSSEQRALVEKQEIRKWEKLELCKGEGLRSQWGMAFAGPSLEVDCVGRTVSLRKSRQTWWYILVTLTFGWWRGGLQVGTQPWLLVRPCLKKAKGWCHVAHGTAFAWHVPSLCWIPSTSKKWCVCVCVYCVCP